MVSAAQRLVTAVGSWTRELGLEIDANLTKIVQPLTAAFQDSKEELARANLGEPVPCRRHCEEVVKVLKAISETVTEPWNTALAGGLPAYELLSGQWKQENPLQSIGDGSLLWEFVQCVQTGEEVPQCNTCCQRL